MIPVSESVVLGKVTVTSDYVNPIENLFYEATTGGGQQDEVIVEKMLLIVIGRCFKGMPYMGNYHMR